MTRRELFLAAAGSLLMNTEASAQTRPVTPRTAFPAWPTKMWISTFHTHTEQYLGGGQGDVIGNAITLTGSSTDPQGIVRELRRTRQDSPATPIICVPSWEADQLEFVGRIVAWWTAGADDGGLAAAVQAAHAHTPKAVWAYLDRRGWSATRPWWVTDQVLPALQCYRNPGESLDAFDAAIRQDLDAVAGYDRPCVLTLACYDRLQGYLGMKEQSYAIQTLLRGWVEDYPVVGLHLFADRRPGGMRDYPVLRTLADAMVLANPARPNRYDYWQHGDLTTVYRNKLGQTTPLIALTAPEKAYLRSVLGV